MLLLKTADAFEKPTDMRKEVLQRANPNSIKSKVITEKVSEYDRLDGKSFFCMSKHSNFRQSLRDMVRNRSFGNGILACIMVSTAAYVDADCFSGISSSTHASTGYLRRVDGVGAGQCAHERVEEGII